MQLRYPNWSPLSDPRGIIDCLCGTCRMTDKTRFSDSIERRESAGGREDEEAMWLTGFMVYSTSRRVHREAYNIVSSLRFGLTAWVSDDVPWCMTRCRVPIRRASMKAGSVPDVKYRRFGMKRSTLRPVCVHVVDEDRRLRLFERLLLTRCTSARFYGRMHK